MHPGMRAAQLLLAPAGMGRSLAPFAVVPRGLAGSCLWGLRLSCGCMPRTELAESDSLCWGRQQNQAAGSSWNHLQDDQKSGQGCFRFNARRLERKGGGAHCDWDHKTGWLLAWWPGWTQPLTETARRLMLQWWPEKHAGLNGPAAVCLCQHERAGGGACPTA